MRFYRTAPHRTILQGGRRYFSRREINALVGGPGNMAVYRHILVIPPTAKVVTAKKRQTAYHQNSTAVLHYRRNNTATFWFYRFRQKSTANSRFRRKEPPTLKRYRPHWIPPKRYRRHWVSPKRYRRYWIPPKRYSVHWIPPKKYRRFFSCSFFVLCSFWFFGLLFGRTSL